MSKSNGNKNHFHVTRVLKVRFQLPLGGAGKCYIQNSQIWIDLLIFSKLGKKITLFTSYCGTIPLG